MSDVQLAAIDAVLSFPGFVAVSSDPFLACPRPTCGAAAAWLHHWAGREMRETGVLSHAVGFLEHSCREAALQSQQSFDAAV